MNESSVINLNRNAQLGIYGRIGNRNLARSGSDARRTPFSSGNIRHRTKMSVCEKWLRRPIRTMEHLRLSRKILMIQATFSVQNSIKNFHYRTFDRLTSANWVPEITIYTIIVFITINSDDKSFRLEISGRLLRSNGFLYLTSVYITSEQRRESFSEEGSKCHFLNSSLLNAQTVHMWTPS